MGDTARGLYICGSYLDAAGHSKHVTTTFPLLLPIDNDDGRDNGCNAERIFAFFGTTKVSLCLFVPLAGQTVAISI